MKKRAFNFTDGKTGACLAIYVIVRAANDHFAGTTEDNVVKIRLASPTVTAANSALLSFLSQQLNIDAAQLEIVAGKNKAHKLVSFEGYSTSDLEKRLLAVM